MSKNHILLSREAFSEAVFSRDGGKCVICSAPAVDPHHIIDRALFPDGGYYLDNGASVCSEHHMQCETTVISVEEVWKACGITNPALPPHFAAGEIVDKWGNPVLPNGTRLRGEMFDNENVQKALAKGGKLDLFTHYVKYPRTLHFDWSASVQSDDKVLKSVSAMEGKRVIGTIKMDGENTTLYSDYIHARSIDGRHHPSRNWVKSHWSSIRHDIPEFWRICGENLFAKHSITYDELPSYFMGFSVWNDRNVCLAWDDTLEWFELLGIVPVEVVYDGIFDAGELKRIARDLFARGEEGLVVRVADEIPYADFSRMVGKDVRPGHVQTDEHWMYGAGVTEQNKLADVSSGHLPGKGM